MSLHTENELKGLVLRCSPTSGEPCHDFGASFLQKATSMGLMHDDNLSVTDGRRSFEVSVNKICPGPTTCSKG